mmetsp:Transcript_20795/g.51014  ORF Transcript_20795/g.51014 Transcript_20795/m.51014 type:complete len:166 (-) Transcript_20795:157-654(-)
MFTREGLLDWAGAGAVVGGMSGATIALLQGSKPHIAAITFAADGALSLSGFYILRSRMEYKRKKADRLNTIVAGALVGYFLGGYNLSRVARGIKGSVAGAVGFSSCAVGFQYLFEYSKRYNFEIIRPKLGQIRFPEWFPMQFKPSETNGTETRNSNIRKDDEAKR